MVLEVALGEWQVAVAFEGGVFLLDEFCQCLEAWFVLYGKLGGKSPMRSLR